MILPTLFGAVILTTGCTVMSESDCINADWYTVGEADGRGGRSQSRLLEYFETCAKYGVTPNRDEYEAGHEHGLTFYCTESNGYQVGRSGMSYRGACPSGLELGFLSGYYIGDNVGRAENKVRQLDRRIRSARQNLKDLIREIEQRESAEDSDQAEEEGEDEKKSGDDKDADALKQMYRELGTIEGALEGWYDERIEAVVDYRYAVDEARRRGFAEVYQY